MNNAKITKFAVSDMRDLRNEVDAALAALGEKYGIVFHAGNASGDREGTHFTYKLDVRLADGPTKQEQKAEKAENDLPYFHKRYFPDLNLDSTYAMGRDVFKIVGYNTRGRVSPMVIVNIKTGKQFKCGIESLRNARVIA